MRVRAMAHPHGNESLQRPNCGHEIALTAADLTGAAAVTTTATVRDIPEVPDVAEVRESVLALLRAILEVIAGNRRLVTVAAHVSRPVQHYLTSAMLHYRNVGVVRPRSVRLTRPVESVIEAALVVEIGGRVRAAAVGLRQTADDGWSCHALRIL